MFVLNICVLYTQDFVYIFSCRNVFSAAVTGYWRVCLQSLLRNNGNQGQQAIYNNIRKLKKKTGERPPSPALILAMEERPGVSGITEKIFITVLSFH